MTIKGILTVIGLAFGTIFTLLFKYFQNESKAKIGEIQNEQNEIENEQLEEELEEIADSERTDTYIDSLSDDDIARKLHEFEEADKRDEAAKN